jgi:PAS domain S-box-containing protein
VKPPRRLHSLPTEVAPSPFGGAAVGADRAALHNRGVTEAAANPPPVAADERLYEALTGTGTSLWEWYCQRDVLSDLDEGSAMLGYAPGEIAPTQRAWDELIHPEDRADNDAAYARHAHGEVEVYAHEYRIRARDGSWRWMAERGRIVERAPDGTPLRMLGTQTDITERRRAQGAAIELAERLNKIAGHVPGMVFQFQRLADGSARFPYVSERCLALTGVAPDVLMRDASAMLRRVERAERAGLLAAIAESQRTLRPWRSEFRRHVPGAGPRWLRGAATPQHAADGSTLWHGYIEDVSDLHELEQARFARHVAEAANRAKSEFLSRVSHELRTPLNAVLGFAQLMELDAADPLSAQQVRRLALIREAGEHLLHMIGDLLDLTQFDAGQLKLEPTRVELATLLRECADMLRPQADAAAVRIELDALGAGLATWADRRRLKQVVANLVSNAVKYNRRGGWVRLSVEPHGDGVCVRCADGGIGITPAQQARMFEPFNRLGQERSTIEGTGLGLALSRSLVEAMGGRIEVRSEPGAGSTFSVVLPAAALR